MKVEDLIQQRRQNWDELEAYLAGSRRLRGKKGREVPLTKSERIYNFTRLYRAACADLALADAYQLPPSTVQYLHKLVARAHNQLYRSKRFSTSQWWGMLFNDVPKLIFRDRYVQFMFFFFWSIFLGSAAIAATPELWPDYPEHMVGNGQLENLESMYAEPLSDRPTGVNLQMVGFYIWHNTSIGLQCFAGGLLIVPGILITLFNAASLGAMFGYMARPDIYSEGTQAGTHFFEFVTAHGPFELTAIVLSAGAGLRIGMSWVHTHGLSRRASLAKTATETLPVMCAAMVLFAGAALIEGIISPSGMPYEFKYVVGGLTAAALLIYFIILGVPRGIPKN
ncbi:MAG: stage II sporulation protein M [Pirellulaceae bacterium]|nr:stage II sporulation protein M [Pirellulaceae bacterium]